MSPSLEHFAKKYISFQSQIWDLFQKLLAESPCIQLYVSLIIIIPSDLEI